MAEPPPQDRQPTRLRDSLAGWVAGLDEESRAKLRAAIGEQTIRRRRPPANIAGIEAIR